MKKNKRKVASQIDMSEPKQQIMTTGYDDLFDFKYILINSSNFEKILKFEASELINDPCRPLNIILSLVF